MTHPTIDKVAALLFFMVMLAPGCQRNAPPTPLSLDQVPAAMEKAFLKAKPEIKSLASQAALSVQNKRYPTALLQLQNLSATRQLTDEQGTTVARCLLSVNAQLQSAASTGDQQAADLLKARMMSK